MKISNCDIFVHVPKAAGTTVHSIFEKNYSPLRQFSFRAPREQALERFQRLSQESRDRFQMVKGHCGYGIHNFINSKVRYVTFLRDPVKRVISEYYYVKRHPRPSNHALLNREDISLRDYVEAGIYTDNMHLRFLTFMRLEDAPEGPAKEEWLEPAKKLLEERFESIGIVERFDESMLLMAQDLDLSDVTYIRQNSRKESAEETDEVKCLIREKESLDIQLYDFALNIFESRWSDYLKKNSDALMRFQCENKRKIFKRKILDRMTYYTCRSIWKLRGYW
ncbi:MAG: sulfotransferase family 2 domain-containing protein [Opitutales bacterium]